MSEPEDDLLELTATHIDLAGDGVGTCGDLTVSAHGLFATERASVEIVHHSHHRPEAVARVVTLLGPHPARREAPCEQHESRTGQCGGCALMPLDEDAQREQKLGMLKALGLLPDRIVAGASLGYRWSSKRVAFIENGRLYLGSWARRSHWGASMRGCLVDHPLVRDAADEVEREARALGVEAYDETRKSGSLRYVWLKTNGVDVLVTLIAARDDEAVRALASRLTRASGVAFSLQSGAGNVIRGETAEVLVGAPKLLAQASGIEVSVGPLGFLQPNLTMIAAAYDALVTDEAGAPLSGALAWDLYAGTGITTAMLRRSFTDVTPCESHAENAADLGVAPMKAGAFIALNATERPDLIVANPPRKGLGQSVCDALLAVGAPRLHVMSCGPKGLSRDLEALTTRGYALTSLVAYDTLPQTPHVELVAKLARGS